jgi:hypothetical protein
MIAPLLAALALGASCAATPVHGEPLPHSGSLLAQLPWVQATPSHAGIVGMLFAYDPALETGLGRPEFALWARGAAPGGWSTKILWIVRNVHVTNVLTIRGSEIGGTGRFAQHFGIVFDHSPERTAGRMYASIVRIPSGGCWRLDVASGRVRGSLVVRAVEP